MILPLIYYGNPILRKKAVIVEEITDEIRALVVNMVETMDHSKGVGIAANQVGSLFKIFIIRSTIVAADGSFELGPFDVFINPILSSPSERTQKFSEGCLSIPGLHIDVERPFSIHIEANDLEGKKTSKTVEGFEAVEIMHENDHLNGVLFVDRIPDFKKKEIEPILREVKKKYKS